MAIGGSYTWQVLSDGLPPTLNTRAPTTSLRSNETPASYGVEANKDGFLTIGSCPSATAVVEKTYVVGADTYIWHFDRLWRASGTQIIYGAPQYSASYFPQGLGHVDIPEDSNSVLKLVPVGNAIIAFKTSGAFLLQNAADHGGNFEKWDIIQTCGITAASNAIQVDGTVYASTANGLYAIDSRGQTTELTGPVRGSNIFKNTALTLNYQNKYVIGATDQYCYDINNKRLLDYSTAGFLYTAPSLRMTARGYAGSPFTISDVAFEIQFIAAGDGQVKFQTQFDSRGWNEVQTFDIINERGATERVHVALDIQENARAFGFRLTDLNNVMIRRIYVKSADFTEESFDA